jgi:hypothetical protein
MLTHPICTQEGKAKALSLVSRKLHTLTEMDGALLPVAVFAPLAPNRMMFPTMASSYHFTLFKARALALLGLPQVSERRAKLRIGVRIKHDRGRRFLNHEEIVRYLRERYGEVADVVEYTPDEMKAFSMREEVEMARGLDVYLTPSGGGSFSGIFVRDGGTVIYGAFPCCVYFDSLTRMGLSFIGLRFVYHVPVHYGLESV